MKRARGKPSKASTIPNASGSPVSFNASQGVAIKANWSPSREVVAPAKSRRKSRKEITRNIGLGRVVVSCISNHFLVIILSMHWAADTEHSGPTCRPAGAEMRVSLRRLHRPPCKPWARHTVSPPGRHEISFRATVDSALAHPPIRYNGYRLAWEMP